jgi:hypothetical protein
MSGRRIRTPLRGNKRGGLFPGLFPCGGQQPVSVVAWDADSGLSSSWRKPQFGWREKSVCGRQYDNAQALSRHTTPSNRTRSFTFKVHRSPWFVPHNPETRSSSIFSADASRPDSLTHVLFHRSLHDRAQRYLTNAKSLTDLPRPIAVFCTMLWGIDVGQMPMRRFLFWDYSDELNGFVALILASVALGFKPFNLTCRMALLLGSSVGEDE